MELTANHIAIILGVTLSVGITTAACYLTGHNAGARTGHKRGHADGYDSALDDLMPELNETAMRLNSAERTLAATQTELRQVKDERACDRRNAAEAIEELTLRLDEAKGLNGAHATVLRQAANNLEMAATTWESMTATTKARHARTNAQQLRDLAATLAPEQQEAAA
ncbi:hypothetical protein [Azotobacter chroococcum]|uniref:hypothetical protein n=1 Tax=Azotobacter chroococcum TaxID=353 RepID=UPI0010AEADDE|nr:hypothetical protein [Azotobacter chroococcum]TKD40729.1 hypothetical protein FCG41_09380 [Azotobacter chroococcum]